MTELDNVTDSTGYVLKFAKKPEHIVAVSLASSEILVGLVLVSRVAALSYLVDDSRISNITAEAKQVPAKIKANAETIIALQPDLVLVASWQPAEFIQTLRAMDVPVYVYKQPNSIEEIKQVITEIAQVVGQEQTGAQMIAQMDGELAKVTERVSNIPKEERQVVALLTITCHISGKGNIFDDICHWACVENGSALAGLGRTGVLSKEQIVAINPDIFVLPEYAFEKIKEDLVKDPALQTVKAIRQNKLIAVPDRYLSSSSQYVVYGVRDLAKVAYPLYSDQQ